jgi:uncharacterized membrane protein
MFYFVIFEKKHFAGVFFAFLLCCTRETLPLLIAGMGLYLLLDRKTRRSGIVYFIAGIAAFGVIVLIIMPYYKAKFIATSDAPQSLVYFSDRYGYIQGNTNAARLVFLVTHPLLVAKYVFLTPWFKWLTFLGLYAFLLFLPLFDLRWSIISVFTVVIYYLSGTEIQFLYNHQYFCEIFPPIFIASMTGLQKVLQKYESGKERIRCTVTILLVLVSIASGLYVGGYYAIFKYREALPYFDQFQRAFEDRSGIGAMKDDEVGLFVHDKLFYCYGWKKYLAGTNQFHDAYTLYRRMSTIKRMYIVSINEPVLGHRAAENFKGIVNEAEREGFVKIDSYKNYVMYEKIIKK